MNEGCEKDTKLKQLQEKLEVIRQFLSHLAAHLVKSIGLHAKLLLEILCLFNLFLKKTPNKLALVVLKEQGFL